LAVEHNELLAEDGIFDKEVSLAAGHISDGAPDKGGGGGFGPLFEPAAQMLPEPEDSCEHVVMASPLSADCRL
jgi:hypothetical protein